MEGENRERTQGTPTRTDPGLGTPVTHSVNGNRQGRGTLKSKEGLPSVLSPEDQRVPLLGTGNKKFEGRDRVDESLGLGDTRLPKKIKRFLVLPVSDL